MQPGDIAVLDRGFWNAINILKDIYNIDVKTPSWQNLNFKLSLESKINKLIDLIKLSWFWYL